MKTTERVPKGSELLKTLIELLADQENVIIKYVIEEHGATIKGTTERN